MKNRMQQQKIIEKYWEDLQSGSISISNSEIQNILVDVLRDMDSGQLKIHERQSDGEWYTTDWIRKAIVLYIKTSSSTLMHGNYFDKVPLKFTSWQEQDFTDAKIRIVPGSIVRYGSYIDKNCVIMPSFINIGAYIDEGTMIDSNVTVGSCSYIGQKCHIGAGTIIGGVLEPLSAKPVIVEDNVFIGANCSVTEGITIHSGAVLASGVNISASTKIYDTIRGEIIYGYIPSDAVVVQGAMPDITKKYYTSCVLIKKYVDVRTRERVSINDLLR